MQEVTTTEWNSAIRVPLCVKSSFSNSFKKKPNRTDLLRLEEILSIIQQHLLNAGIEHDRGYRPLVAGVCPAPTTMGVCEVDLDAVDGFGLMFPLRLEN
jgi:hypothetical protein